MNAKKYAGIVSHYEACLREHGDTHLGVDWPKEADANTRYAVMLEVIKGPKPATVTLLDFGCGAAHLYQYMCRCGIGHIDYSGLDLSPRFIELCRRKFPSLPFYCLDILERPEELPPFDYIVMNGVFTEKRELTYGEMFDYFTRTLRATFAKARIGIAFNVMAKHVDWERDDLFHVPFDELAELLCRELTRNFVYRNDYGLYEYTTYVYR